MARLTSFPTHRFPGRFVAGAVLAAVAVVIPLANATPSSVFQATATTGTSIPPTTFGPTTQVPQPAPLNSPTTTPKNLLPSTTVPAENLDDTFVPEEIDGGNGQLAAGTNLPASSVAIGGPPVETKTEGEANFVFTGIAGQMIAIRSNREWTLADPLGREIAERGDIAIELEDSGKYVIEADSGLTSPAKVQVIAVDPNPIVTTAVVGGNITFSSTELRQQIARVPLLGGQRYQLTTNVYGSEFSACVQDWTGVNAANVACVTAGNGDAVSSSFVLTSDQTVAVVPTSFDEEQPSVETVTIERVDNDIILDTTSNPRVDQTPAIGQSVVIPFWGSPTERAVLSSPVEENVAAWGQPWIDREEVAAARVKVFAVPVTFDPRNAPFVAWTGVPNQDSNQRVYGVYRGEDTPLNVPTTGEPVTIRNKPWFAAIASLQLQPGDRYAIQVTGKNIRPLSVALRDPSGKFTSSLSPWQWTDSNGDQRAITTVSADRGGKWALELRPAGNNVRDMAVSVIKVGGNGSYEGVIEVDDVLAIGEATDVQLGPNEFARLTVKLNSATPQIIQPEVLRYRNKTFQPTAVDMSVWDSRGRLVWSNNRNLEEEVLSGRLGQEPQLSEKFATVSSSEPYTLIIDPKVDLAGRFRVSVKSTPVITDVKLGDGAIPLLPGGTVTGVVEVRQPTRYRLTGANACLSVTSLVEWNARKSGGLCLISGQSISLPPGVHRFGFSEPLRTAASFAVVAPGSPPDPVVDLAVVPDGGAVRVAGRQPPVLVTVNVTTPGTRLAFEEILNDQNGKQITAQIAGSLVLPSGLRRNIGGVFVAPTSGRYSLWLQPKDSDSRDIRVRRVPSEVQNTSLSIGAKSKQFTLVWGQRLEATIKITTKTRIEFDTFNAQFLYAADSRERRFAGSEAVQLPPGTYRFVFVGNGGARVRLIRGKWIQGN